MAESSNSSEKQNPSYTSKSQDDVEWIDFDFLFGIVQRQWKVVAAAMVVGLILGLAYILSATPLYTSSVRLFYEKSKTNVVNDLTTQSGVFQDQSEFSSQMELIRSQRILYKTVEALNLQLDDAFLNEGSSSLKVLMRAARDLFDVSSWFKDVELSESDLEARKGRAMGIIASNIEVFRVGVTYIMQVQYTSENPETAQKIAAQLARSYLDDQLDSKYEAAKHASVWLQSRIDELKAQSVAADLAVQQYKSDNNLIGVGAGANIAEAQLAGANAQLIAVKGEVATKKAQYEKLNEAIKSGNITIVVDAALGSKIIENLREKYLDLSKREAEFSARLGDKHAQVINLRNEMREYQRLMFDELTRLRDSAKSQYDVALDREKVLEGNLKTSVGATSEANRVQVRLRELEREAATYKSLLENFLQKYQAALQQQTLPVNEARVIQGAYRPGTPSYPKKMTSLAIALILGGVFGAGIGGIREFMERFFRTGDQVRDLLDMEFLGLVPKVTSENSWSDRKPKSEDMDSRAVRFSGRIGNFVRMQPLSSFAETLRGAKVAANFSLEEANAKIIGVISSLPGEGKSTISSNFAQLLALQGSKTLLIDGDMRNPGLSRMIAPHAKTGLVERLMREANDELAIMYDPDVPQFKFLPTVLNSRISHTSDLLSSQQMLRLLDIAKQHFEYIVVDLPPVAPVVDVKAFANRVDGFIYVVEWGKTNRSLVKSILDANSSIRQKCLGVILNKANLEQMKHYPDHGSTNQYYSTYSNYYRDDNI